jgi:hypothetical protein
MNTTQALKALSDDDAEEYTETIISALVLYQSWMSGFSRVNHTHGDPESSSYCAVQADRAQRLLNKLNKKENIQ